MQLSETIKLYPTKKQKILILTMMVEYIATVNRLVSDAVSGISIARYTSKDVKALLPAALKNQCVRDANSVLKRYNRNRRQAERKNAELIKQGKEIKFIAKRPVLKKLCCFINNQNYKVKDSSIEFPILVNGKTKRISVKTKMTEQQKDVLANSKLGTMRIVMKNNKLIAQIVYERAENPVKTEGNIMGVDLGIKCPAVSYISDGSVKFYGNGRQNKYIRRHYDSLRRTSQKNKHFDAVQRINNKEQRIMRDIDHKISHDIIKTAVAHNVSVIKLERLDNIRSTTRKSRKNNHSLHNWSFYRLAQFIEYKAKLAGIQVEYVNPAYTSQTCPVCGRIHHANDRNYICKCGFHTHRDLLGAINICNSTEYVGGRNVRHTA